MGTSLRSRLSTANCGVPFVSGANPMSHARSFETAQLHPLSTFVALMYSAFQYL